MLVIRSHWDLGYGLMWQYVHAYNVTFWEWAPSIDMKFIYGPFIVYSHGKKGILDNILVTLCLLLVYISWKIMNFTTTSPCMSIWCFDHFLLPCYPQLVPHFRYSVSYSIIVLPCFRLYLAVCIHEQQEIRSSWVNMAFFSSVPSPSNDVSSAHHKGPGKEVSICSIMSVFRKFWILKPIQSRFSDQGVIFSTAYVFWGCHKYIQQTGWLNQQKQKLEFSDQ